VQWWWFNDGGGASDDGIDQYFNAGVLVCMCLVLLVLLDSLCALHASPGVVHPAIQTHISRGERVMKASIATPRLVENL
jgi:hypothetical protein